MQVVEQACCRPEQETYKIFGIIKTDTVVYPWTVMVEFGNASITF